MTKTEMIDLFEDSEFESWQSHLTGSVFIHDLERSITLDFTLDSFERFFLRIEATRMMLKKLEKKK